MKKVLGNIYIQLFLGLITGVIGTIISYPLAVIFYIKYAGFSLFDIGSSGDKSPITFTIALFFIVLTLVFPMIIWLFLKKFGNLNSLSRRIKIITFILFASLPLWTYLGWGAFEKLQITYRNYRSVRNDCIIKNGVNRITVGENTKEIECKNGVFNGLSKTYNSKGVLTYEVNYLNGEKDGIEKVYFDDGRIKISTDNKNGTKEGKEVFYNEDMSTSLYIINKIGKSKQIYFQIPEKNLDSEVDLESQNFFCKNQEKYLSKNYSYVCIGSIINGEFIKKDPRGNILLKVNFENGVLDGAYDQYLDEKLYRHLDFKNGILNGKVYKYSTDGNLEYEGQYINGLQDGIFRRYDYKGNIESEVVFENGEIKKINIP